MKLPSGIVVVALLSLCGLAVAESPGRSGRDHEAARAVVDASLLGELEGIVSFCAKANPAGKHDYSSSLRKLIRGIGEDALEDAREKAEYRQNFKGINSMLDAIPSAQRKQACESFFSSGQL